MIRTNYPTRELGRPMDTEAIKRHALRDQRILVASLDDHRLTWDEKELLLQVAAKIHGAEIVAKLRKVG